jgi:hypothetical protein
MTHDLYSMSSANVDTYYRMHGNDFGGSVRKYDIEHCTQGYISTVSAC